MHFYLLRFGGPHCVSRVYIVMVLFLRKIFPQELLWLVNRSNIEAIVAELWIPELDDWLLNNTLDYGLLLRYVHSPENFILSEYSIQLSRSFAVDVVQLIDDECCYKRVVLVALGDSLPEKEVYSDSAFKQLIQKIFKNSIFSKKATLRSILKEPASTGVIN